MLTEESVVPYLLDRSLIEPSAVVEDGVVVEDVSRRNRNYRVRWPGGGLVLKQAVDGATRFTIRNEAAFYERASADGRLRALKPYLPRLRGYDEENAILVLELLTGRNLREQLARTGRFSRRTGSMLGSALASLHRTTWLSSQEQEHQRGVSGAAEALQAFHRPMLGMFGEMSGANVIMIRVIQQFPEMCELLDEVARGWVQSCVLHHDVKWDNCLVVQGRTPELKLLDWELARTGDPCWDVGSAFSSYVAIWLMSIPIMGDRAPENFVNLARYPLERMQPALAAMWRAYVARMEIAPDAADSFLVRSTRYAAVRLIQTAYEQMQYAMALTSTGVCMLQVSMNMLRRPAQAAVQLLGIPFAS